MNEKLPWTRKQCVQQMETIQSDSLLELRTPDPALQPWPMPTNTSVSYAIHLITNHFRHCTKRARFIQRRIFSILYGSFWIISHQCEMKRLTLLLCKAMLCALNALPWSTNMMQLVWRPKWWRWRFWTHWMRQKMIGLEVKVRWMGKGVSLVNNGQNQ